MASPFTDVVFTAQQPDQPTAVKLNKLTRDLSAAIAAGGGGTGTGDMTKAVYDTNNNGKVDTADSIPWGSVTGKPAVFPAALHAVTHLDNGSDPVPVATTSRTGLVPILSSDANTFLNGSGTWSTPQTQTQAQWNYRNILTIADPGSGNLRFDNALAGSVTQIAISRTTANNVDRYNLLKSLQLGDTIQVQDTTASANWIRYRFTAVPTDNASWFLLPVAMVTGSGTTPSNNDLLTLSFSIAGGGGPTGDMLKSVYDTNANNKVDAAESADSVPWTGVTGKPASFTPAAHGATHLDNGSDVVPVVTTVRTGLAPKLSGNAATYLDGTGVFSAVSGSVNPGTWTNLSLGSGWTAPTQAQYRVEVNGAVSTVYFRGTIQSSYANLSTSPFTVPAIGQPSMTRQSVLAGAQNTGTASDVAAYIATISSAGVCSIYFLTGGPFVWADPAQTQLIALDGLQYSL
jgi:hypothetical protein